MKVPKIVLSTKQSNHHALYQSREVSVIRFFGYCLQVTLSSTHPSMCVNLFGVLTASKKENTLSVLALTNSNPTMTFKLILRAKVEV